MTWAAAIADILLDSPVSGIWPLIVLPWIAARLCERGARELPEVNSDWRVAAALASAPGVLLLVLIGAAIARSIFHMHPDGWSHAVQHHFIWVVGPILLAPAIRSWWHRRSALRALLQTTKPANARLARAGARLNLRCELLPASALDCFVAGIVRPTVYVSSGALVVLSDAELEAALCHEKGHIDGHDPAAFAIVTVLGDLVPMSNAALTAFRQARERRADERAVEGCDSVSLASALVAFARAQQRPVPCMATPVSGAWRIEALLSDRTVVASPVASPPGLTASLCLIGWPAAQSGLAYLIC